MNKASAFNELTSMKSMVDFIKIQYDTNDFNQNHINTMAAAEKAIEEGNIDDEAILLSLNLLGSELCSYQTAFEKEELEKNKQNKLAQLEIDYTRKRGKQIRSIIYIGIGIVIFYISIALIIGMVTSGFLVSLTSGEWESAVGILAGLVGSFFICKAFIPLLGIGVAMVIVSKLKFAAKKAEVTHMQTSKDFIQNVVNGENPPTKKVSKIFCDKNRPKF